MANYRDWLDKGDLTASRVPRLMPLLIRQARLETPITYGDAATELGLHHRAVDRIAGYIGFTLEAVGDIRGWKRRVPPPLHALVVNDITRLPGRGINGFMSQAYTSARSREKKRAVLKAVYAELKDYEHWTDLCELLDIPLDWTAHVDAVEEARNARSRGGEGPEHKALKKHVAQHPEVVGLPIGSGKGTPEYPLASGDRIDVVFERRSLRFGVEVKPASASEGDKLRGVFQCVKYRVVLQAESALSDNPFNVKVMLVLGGDVPPKVTQLSNRLGIDVKGGVVPRG